LMPSFRFTIRQMLGVTTFVALACSALVRPSPTQFWIWTGLSLAGFALLVAIAILGRGVYRDASIGALIFCALPVVVFCVEIWDGSHFAAAEEESRVFWPRLEHFHSTSSALWARSVSWGPSQSRRWWMRPYSKEFRGEVLAACDAGEGTAAVALRFNISESWVRRVKQQRRETGQIAPKTTRDRKPKWHAWADWLLAKIAARPDIYLRELQAELKQELGQQASLQTICTACWALKQPLKKRR
jgi:transposase